MDWQALKNEVIKPAYNGMTLQQILDALRVLTVAVDVSNVDGQDIFECIVVSEYTGLTADQKAILNMLCGRSNVNIGPSTQARAFLLATFPQVSKPLTYAKLVAAAAAHQVPFLTYISGENITAADIGSAKVL